MTTTSNGEPSAAAITAAMAAYGLFIGVIFLVTMALVIVIQWRIAAKAGYNGALSLLLLVPMVNFIVLLIFAFGEWPIEAQLRAMRSGAGSGPPMTI